MIKDAAPGVSKDPVQQKLREHKAAWNKEISSFIDNLIHLKKMMNGWPSKFSQDKNRIVNPIPADPVTILGSLASDFNDLAQDGNNIVKEQYQYSQSRRKQMELFPTAERMDYELISEGSNPFSRLFSKFKGPFFGESDERKINVHRKDSLNMAAELNSSIKKFRKSIVGYGDKSIEDSDMYLEQSLAELQNIYDKTKLVKQEFPELFTRKLQDLEETVVDTTGTELENPKESKKPQVYNAIKSMPEPEIINEEAKQYSSEDVDDIKSEYNLLKSLKPDTTLGKIMNDPVIISAKIGLHGILFKYDFEKSNTAKAGMIGTILDRYKILLKVLNENSLLNPEKKDYKTISSILIEFEKNATAFNEMITKQAQLGRWVGKGLHKIKSIVDVKSSQRVEIYNKSQLLLGLSNRLMDSFENGYRPFEFEKILSSINDQLDKIKQVFLMLRRAFYHRKSTPSSFTGNRTYQTSMMPTDKEINRYYRRMSLNDLYKSNQKSPPKK